MTSLKAKKNQMYQIAPAGFYVALRVGFSFPEEELNTLPEIWIEFYTAHSMVVQDPAMQWIYGNVGAARFADIKIPDPQQVRAHAAVLGLSYGAVVSVTLPQDRGRRSYGVFYRDDRDFSDAEIAELQQIMQDLHGGSDGAAALSTAELAALKLQSQGQRLKQIAQILGISESAVKARLNNVKRKLGARTQSQAASIATARRIL